MHTWCDSTDSSSSAIQDTQQQVWFITSQGDTTGAFQDMHHEPAKEATEQLNGSTHHCRESHAQLRRRTRVQHPDPTATSSSSLISSAFRLVARQIRSGQRRSTITVGTADWANLRTMPGTVRRDRAVEGARTTAIQTQRFLELQGLRGMSQRKRRSFVGNENRSN